MTKDNWSRLIATMAAFQSLGAMEVARPIHKINQSKRYQKTIKHNNTYRENKQYRLKGVRP